MLWETLEGSLERRTYICVLLKSQERDKRTKGLHLCALGDSGEVIRTKNLHLRAFGEPGEGQSEGLSER